MAVRVEHESCKVIRRVLGANARRTIVATSGGEACLVERVHHRARAGAEGYVDGSWRGAEDEMLGTYRDKLGDDAASALDRGIDQAKEVAAEAYVTLKKEADKLTSDSSEPLAGRVAKALSATAGKAEDAVRERLPGDGRSPDGDMEH